MTSEIYEYTTPVKCEHNCHVVHYGENKLLGKQWEVLKCSECAKLGDKVEINGKEYAVEDA